MTLEDQFGEVFLLGLMGLVVGVAIGNAAVSKMRFELDGTNQQSENFNWFKLNRANRSTMIAYRGTIADYRKQHGDGPFYRQMKWGYWVAGFSFVLAMASLLFGYMLGR